MKEKGWEEMFTFMLPDPWGVMIQRVLAWSELGWEALVHNMSIAASLRQVIASTFLSRIQPSKELVQTLKPEERHFLLECAKLHGYNAGHHMLTTLEETEAGNGEEALEGYQVEGATLSSLEDDLLSFLDSDNSQSSARLPPLLQLSDADLVGLSEELWPESTEGPAQGTLHHQPHQPLDHLSGGSLAGLVEEELRTEPAPVDYLGPDLLHCEGLAEDWEEWLRLGELVAQGEGRAGVYNETPLGDGGRQPSELFPAPNSSPKFPSGPALIANSSQEDPQVSPPKGLTAEETRLLNQFLDSPEKLASEDKENAPPNVKIRRIISAPVVHPPIQKRPIFRITIRRETKKKSEGAAEKENSETPIPRAGRAPTLTAGAFKTGKPKVWNNQDYPC